MQVFGFTIIMKLIHSAAFISSTVFSVSSEQQSDAWNHKRSPSNDQRMWPF